MPRHNQATITVAVEGEKYKELAALLVYLHQLNHCHMELMLAWALLRVTKIGHDLGASIFFFCSGFVLLVVVVFCLWIPRILLLFVGQ